MIKNIYLFLFIFIYNTSFSFYSQEQIKNYQESFQFGMSTQIEKILDNFKFNLEKNQIQPEIINLFKDLLESNNDPSIIQNSAFIIGEKEIKELSPSLLKIVQESKNSQVKADSLRALGKLEYRETLPLLRKILDTDVNLVKEQALFVIAKLKDHSYNKDLQEILSTSDDNALVEGSLKAMAEIKDPANLESLQSYFKNSPSSFLKSKTALAIGVTNTLDSKKWLKEHLNTEIDATVQIHMLKGYIESGAPITDFIKEYNSALKHSNDDVRKIAIEMLPTTNYPNTIPFLEYTIKNDLKVEIKEQSASSYIAINPKKAAAFFKENIEKGSNFTQVGIIEAIKKEKEHKDVIIQQLFAPLFKETKNPYIQANLVNIASDNLDIQSAQNFLLKDILEKKLNTKNESSYKNKALNALTVKNYSKMLPKLVTILDNPKDAEYRILFDTALKIIAYSKENANKQYIRMLNNLYQTPYHTLQRSDLYSQIQILKPDGIKDQLLKNFSKETDPQTKFQIKRILESYGVNNLDTKLYYRKMA